MSRPDISVLLPTRGRTQLLFSSVHSLLANADDSRRVDFWVAIDPDEDYELSFPGAATVSVWTAPERGGYARLHEYYNALAERAQGTWLMLWNDDALMLTKGWDAVVMSQEPSLLFPKHGDLAAQHCNAFPVWPAEWTRHLGHVSLGCYSDSWLQWMGQELGVQRRVPIRVSHRQPQDKTYCEGSATRPTTGNSLDAALAEDTEKLRQYLEGK